MSIRDHRTARWSPNRKPKPKARKHHGRQVKYHQQRREAANIRRELREV